MLTIRYLCEVVDYETEDKDNVVTEKVLCFRCAVLGVVNKGWNITPEIDNFDKDGNDMRKLTCDNCKSYLA